MGRNNHKKHLLVIFEDQAYKDYFLGFADHKFFNANEIFAGDVLGGWIKVQQQVTDVSLQTLDYLKRFENVFILALLDSDKDKNRLTTIREQIPAQFQERIFLISSFDEAESIKAFLGQGKKENIGYKLAMDCYESDCQFWSNPLLEHNLSELKRLQQTFKIFI